MSPADSPDWESAQIVVPSSCKRTIMRWTSSVSPSLGYPYFALAVGLIAALTFGLIPGVKGNEATVIGLVGEAAELPCDVDVTECGEVYFITWTKNVSNEWKRLYLYSDAVEKPLQELAYPDRADFFIKESSAFLRISPLRLEDEGEYKCDVTYLQGKCPSLSYATLVTHAKPNPPVIEKDGKSVQNGSMVGPMHEGSTLTLECESTSGKPAPELTWTKGSESLTSTKFDITLEKNGAATVSSQVKIELERDDLGARVECHADNEATDTPLMTWVELDVHVGPSSLDVTGPTSPVVAGNEVLLTCTIEGAKPSANATWYNRSEVVQAEPRVQNQVMPDGTYRTISEVEIIVSRHDHQGTYFCKGTNAVLQNKGEAPLLKSIDLHVLYPPVVVVQPAGGIIVNESDSAVIHCTYEANPFNVSDVEWFLGDTQLEVPTEGKYEATNQGYPQLTIRNMNREDRGMYSCSLSNSVGRGNASNDVEINVLYPPLVQASVSPESVNEGNSISLFCDIMDGNPQNLIRVRWYKDDELMNETTEREIVWLGVSRNVTGNYSCEGENAAGWGERSEPEELIVNYYPGEATVIELDPPSIKGEETVLHCDVDDLGYPPATVFIWNHNGKLLLPSGQNFTTEPVALTTKGNYTCAAVNDVGVGNKGFLYLTAKAPPAFLEDLPEDHGAARDAPFISVSCRVECDPICTIEWLKDEESIMDSDLYIIRSTILQQEVAHNRFISVASTLKWNMTAWPGRRLDRDRDNANYTCQSTDNEVGEGVSSTMHFQVEYPPEVVDVSDDQVDVIEGEVPDKVVCSASSWPLSTYTWRFGDTVVSGDEILFFNASMPRDKAGTYKCVAVNSHGYAEAETFINVLYKPTCILREDVDGDDKTVLVCEVEANPTIVNFTWMRDNDTLDEDETDDEQLRSIFTLPEHSMEYFGLYTCIAKNSVGESLPCQLEVSGLGWASDYMDKNIFIVAAAIGGVAILFVLIIIIIIILMRRRRLRTGAKQVQEERQNPEGHVNPPASVISKPAPQATSQANGSPTQKGPGTVVTFKRADDPRRRKRAAPNASSPSKPTPAGTDSLYQNITGSGRKQNGPPPSEAEISAMYENMPFHQQGHKPPFPSGRMRKSLPSDFSHEYENIPHSKQDCCPPLGNNCDIPRTNKSSHKASAAVAAAVAAVAQANGKTPPHWVERPRTELLCSSTSDQMSMGVKDVERPRSSSTREKTTKHPLSKEKKQCVWDVGYLPEHCANMKGANHCTNLPGVIYADLALPSKGAKPLSRKDAVTEYATLKFNREAERARGSLQAGQQ